MFGPTSFPTHAFSTSNMKNGTALYQRARSTARKNALISFLIRRDHTLSGLEDLLNGLKVLGQRYAGRSSVSIDQIIGSEGRTEDFDRQFYPRSDRNRDRWLSVLSARLHRVSLPPVALLQVGDQYIVRDGNHRISVARALGESFIEAEVTILETTA